MDNLLTQYLKINFKKQRPNLVDNNKNKEYAIPQDKFKDLIDLHYDNNVVEKYNFIEPFMELGSYKTSFSLNKTKAFMERVNIMEKNNYMELMNNLESVISKYFSIKNYNILIFNDNANDNHWIMIPELIVNKNMAQIINADLESINILYDIKNDSILNATPLYLNKDRWELIIFKNGDDIHYKMKDRELAHLICQGSRDKRITLFKNDNMMISLIYKLEDIYEKNSHWSYPYVTNETDYDYFIKKELESVSIRILPNLGDNYFENIENIMMLMIALNNQFQEHVDKDNNENVIVDLLKSHNGIRDEYHELIDKLQDFIVSNLDNIIYLDARYYVNIVKNNKITIWRQIMINHVLNYMILYCNGSDKRIIGDDDASNFFYRMFSEKYKFVSVAANNNSWYVFDKHRWRIQTEKITPICTDYDKTFKAIMLAAKGLFESLLSATTTDWASINKIMQVLNNSLYRGLGSLRSVTTVSNWLKTKMYDNEFNSRKDTKLHLLCFENGVYDLNLGEFRPGRPSDNITLSTRVNYVPYNPHSNSVQLINALFDSCFIGRNENKEFIKTKLASFLMGNINEEKLFMFFGGGRNGKSRLIQLINSALGDYVESVPSTVLNSKPPAQEAADPQLFKCQGKRMVFTQEVTDSKPILSSELKKWTSNDKITARNLFAAPITFAPQHRLIMTCNIKPEIDNNDIGTWARILIMPFETFFTDNPSTKKNSRESKLDRGLSDKMVAWKSDFVSMLIHIYNSRVKNREIEVPKQIQHECDSYRLVNDDLLKYLNNEYQLIGHKEDKEGIKSMEFIKNYKIWCQKMKKRSRNDTYIVDYLTRYTKGRYDTEKEILYGYVPLDRYDVEMEAEKISK